VIVSNQPAIHYPLTMSCAATAATVLVGQC
jgi:hypothetical protein